MKKNEFEKFRISEFLLEKLTLRRITVPTKIQEEVIPKIRDGKEVIGQSMTGTGKTISYLIPVIDHYIKTSSKEKTLILVPTKELAVQIYNEACYYTEGTHIKPILLIPGKDIDRQSDDLKKHSEFVIAVPGRIIKMIDSGDYKLSDAERVILDEADFLIDLGFMKELEKIFSFAKRLKQLLIFSATLSAKTKIVIDLAHNQKSAARVDPKHSLPASIENLFIPISDDLYRDKTLLKIFDLINPFLSIVFTRTKDESEKVFKLLKEKKINAALLNGNLKAGQRKKIISDFREAKFQYLVATDLAGRGLDFEGITHIINYTQPYNELDYIHRAGRTGRMNNSGIVISICNELDEGYLKKYAENINIILKPVKLTKNGVEDYAGYKGVKPRFNIKELKQKEKIEESLKKEKENTREKKNVVNKTGSKRRR